MANLFKKAAVFTDLHLGLKSNSAQHNEDCVAFTKWFITKAQAEGCDTCLLTGDWHNHRATINIQTLNYSMQCLDLINDAFSQTFMLTGNHDQFYRENRSVHSVGWAGYMPNIHIVNEVIKEGDVTLCPWLIGDDVNMIKKINSTYTFGHFELPHFYMNAQILMPDHGSVKLDDFGNTGTVFSGHFHKRQSQKNIWYIGNAFPHNYADANDDERGMMVLEWGGKPEFHAWPDQPRYRVCKLSEILESPETLLLPNSHVRVHLDITISYEEANFIRETLIPQHQLREMTLIPVRMEAAATDTATPGKFESPDQIIIAQLGAIESEFYDKKILLDIYNAL